MRQQAKEWLFLLRRNAGLTLRCADIASAGHITRPPLRGFRASRLAAVALPADCDIDAGCASARRHSCFSDWPCQRVTASRFAHRCTIRPSSPHWPAECFVRAGRAASDAAMPRARPIASSRRLLRAPRFEDDGPHCPAASCFRLITQARLPFHHAAEAAQRQPCARRRMLGLRRRTPCRFCWLASASRSCRAIYRAQLLVLDEYDDTWAPCAAFHASLSRAASQPPFPRPVLLML